MSNDFFERVGVLADSNVSSDLELRLAHWRSPNEAYVPLYREVLPQDRFVPGEPNEFVADLDFREWSIDDFGGGALLGDRWSPDTQGFALMVRWFLNRRGFPQVGPQFVQNQASGGGNFTEGAQLFVANGQQLYAVLDGSMHLWTDGVDTFASSGISTGSTADIVSVVQVGDDVYLANASGEIRKVTDAFGTDSNSLHVQSSTLSGWTGLALANFDERLFVLDRNDLYEVDQSTADTVTLVSDLSDTVWHDTVTQAQYLSPYRLTTTDSGVAWWVQNNDGTATVWEYNVGSDTTSRFGQLPGVRLVCGQIKWGFGFVFVPFQSAEGTYIWYKRAGVEGVIGPIPSDRTRNSIATQSDQSVIEISGFVGSTMIVLLGTSVYAYDLGTGAWSALGEMNTRDISSDVPNSIVFKDHLFFGNATVAGRVMRMDINTSGDLSAVHQGTIDPTLETGRWHFGYPTTYKTFSEVRVQLEEALQSGDTLTISAAADGGSFSSIGTMTSTDGTSKTFSPDVRGFELDLRVALTARNNGTTDEIVLQGIRARAITAEARREWALIADASNASSAGSQLADHELQSILDDFKESGAIVTFTNPWDVRSVTTPITYSRCRVADVQSVPVTESPDDQREIVIRLREVDVIGRDVVT